MCLSRVWIEYEFLLILKKGVQDELDGFNDQCNKNLENTNQKKDF